jgi:hypothetical protein
MPDTKHTPGPWTFALGKFNAINPPPDAIGSIMGTWGQSDWFIATVEGASVRMNPPDEIDREIDAMTVANANLMTAAPDLLKALRQALNCLRIHNLDGVEDVGGWGQGPDGWQGSIGDVIRAAIVKAEEGDKQSDMRVPRL